MAGIVVVFFGSSTGGVILVVTGEGAFSAASTMETAFGGQITNIQFK